MVGDIFQPTHLLFIFVVALLVLGPKRLPEVGRALGKGLRDFRGAMAGIEEHTTGLLNMDEPQRASTTPATSAPAAATPQVVTEPAPIFDEPPKTATSSTSAAIAHARASSHRTPAAQAAVVEHDPSEYSD